MISTHFLVGSFIIVFNYVEVLKIFPRENRRKDKQKPYILQLYEFIWLAKSIILISSLNTIHSMQTNALIIPNCALTDVSE